MRITKEERELGIKIAALFIPEAEGSPEERVNKAIKLSEGVIIPYIKGKEINSKMVNVGGA